ncbi:MAG: NAD-dependent epimerase/dehydratase family protein [Acidobacteria bacterium]|nr:NAD-dependent epimerase/dehydratase family protein [Acidobacteriota bacterium]
MTDFSHRNPLVSPDRVKPWLDAIPQPVAITGGTGFVGSHLVDALCAAGIEPRILVRDPEAPRWIANAPVRWVVGSLSDPRALDELVDNAGTVFHLAGVLRAGREREFDEGNRLGTASLVSAMQETARGSRLINVSSLAAVGPSRSPEGVGPEAVPAPISWYGRSKLAAEDEVRKWEGYGGWSILRPAAIYGPRDTDVFEFFRMASSGLVGLPAGERWLTVAWVGDVVRSILAAASGSVGEVFHVGEAEPLELEGLIDSLCEIGGVKARVLRVPPALVSGAGVIGSVLQRLGWRRLALTSDKSRELLARHWTARTGDSLKLLGVTDLTPWRVGVDVTWTWYRDRGWLN